MSATHDQLINNAAFQNIVKEQLYQVAQDVSKENSIRGAPYSEKRSALAKQIIDDPGVFRDSFIVIVASVASIQVNAHIDPDGILVGITDSQVKRRVANAWSLVAGVSFVDKIRLIKDERKKPVPHI